MERTLLIGLDGATWTVLDPLMADGVMPFVHDLVATGARGELRSTLPPLGAPAWTSLATGRSPGAHGVFDAVRSVPGRPGARLGSTDVRAERVWAMASAHGARVVALNLPLMAPPSRRDGFVVPGFLPWRELPRAVHPPDLRMRLEQLLGPNVRELALDPALDERAIEAGWDRDMAQWIRFHARRERQWFEIFSDLLLHEEPDLIAGVFDGPEKVQHACWRFLDRALLADPPTAADARMRALALEYFRQLDRYVEALVRLAGPETRTLLVSAHGFGPAHRTFHVNVWLERQGLLAWARNGRRDGPPVDWPATTACALTAASQGVWLHGVEGAERRALRERIVRDLLAERDPATGRPVLTAVVPREEAFPGPAAAAAPDLTLIPADGVAISALDGAAPVLRRRSPAGMHRPEGVLAAAGPGVRAGARITDATVLDVAPTLLRSLGLPVPEELEGRVLTELFDFREPVGGPLHENARRAAAPDGTGRLAPWPHG